MNPARAKASIKNDLTNAIGELQWGIPAGFGIRCRIGADVACMDQRLRRTPSAQRNPRRHNNATTVAAYCSAVHAKKTMFTNLRICEIHQGHSNSNSACNCIPLTFRLKPRCRFWIPVVSTANFVDYRRSVRLQVDPKSICDCV